MRVEFFLVIAALLFTIGAVGVLVRRNVIVMLMCIELMLCAVNIVFAAFARFHGDGGGHIFVLMSFAVAAAEAAIGLALLVEIYRRRRTVDVDELKALME